MHWMWVGEVFQVQHLSPIGMGCLACNLRDRLTYTMPDPHLSHMGSFWAFPIDEATFVVGALTLLNPDGLVGSPGGGRTVLQMHGPKVFLPSRCSAREG